MGLAATLRTVFVTRTDRPTAPPILQTQLQLALEAGGSSWVSALVARSVDLYVSK